MTIKFKNSEFCKQEASFFGHQFAIEGLKFDNSKVQAIKNYPSLRNNEQLKQLIGACNYYNHYVEKYSDHIIIMPWQVIFSRFMMLGK